MKALALQMYVEGLSFGGIGKILGVSDVSALNWIKTFGVFIETLHDEQRPLLSGVEVMNIRDIRQYIEER